MALTANMSETNFISMFQNGANTLKKRVRKKISMKTGLAMYRSHKIERNYLNETPKEYS